METQLQEALERDLALFRSFATAFEGAGLSAMADRARRRADEIVRLLAAINADRLGLVSPSLAACLSLLVFVL